MVRCEMSEDRQCRQGMLMGTPVHMLELGVSWSLGLESLSGWLIRASTLLYARVCACSVCFTYVFSFVRGMCQYAYFMQETSAGDLWRVFERCIMCCGQINV